MRRAPRGFTLVEMLVSAAIFSLMATFIVAAVITNQRLFQNNRQLVEMQGGLRAASAQLEKSLSLAGYGIDPNYALEPWALDPLTGTAVAGGERDGLGPFGSDELVVQYRDPFFSRSVVGANTTQILVSGTPPPASDFLPGQRLLAICDGTLLAAYVTVGTYAAGLIMLAPGDFPFNQRSLLANSCFSSGSAWLFRVERRRYFIAWLQDATSGSGTGLRPALLVDRGVDVDLDGTPGEAPTATNLGDAELVALDVEQLQVAYLANRPSTAQAAAYGLVTGPDTNGNFVYGDGTAPDVPNPGAPNWPGAGSAPTMLSPPLLSEAGCGSRAMGDDSCALTGKRRFTGHPGNLRAVRYSLAARSSLTDPNLGATRLDISLGGDGPMENLLPADLAADPPSQRRRLRLQGSVSLRNIFQRAHFVPVRGASLTVDGS